MNGPQIADLTPERLAELRRLADEATPGEWWAKGAWFEDGKLVQAALDDPRPGDIFHEMYAFGVQVLAVDDRGVHWRSFNRAEVGRGIETPAKWSESFRYGDHMPGKHTKRLLERGPETCPTPPGQSASPEESR